MIYTYMLMYTIQKWEGKSLKGMFWKRSFYWNLKNLYICDPTGGAITFQLMSSCNACISDTIYCISIKIKTMDTYMQYLLLLTVLFTALHLLTKICVDSNVLTCIYFPFLFRKIRNVILALFRTSFQIQSLNKLYFLKKFV